VLRREWSVVVCYWLDLYLSVGSGISHCLLGRRRRAAPSWRWRRWSTRSIRGAVIVGGGLGLQERNREQAVAAMREAV
jgi:hypothetical protein